MTNETLFQTDQELLSEESWRLLLKKPTEKELYMERQREILEGIFK